MLEILAAQIVSLRVQVGGLQAQIDAMAAALEEAMRQAQPVDAPACTHPETENVGTFGAPDHRCTQCHAKVAA